MVIGVFGCWMLFPLQLPVHAPVGHQVLHRNVRVFVSELSVLTTMGEASIPDLRWDAMKTWAQYKAERHMVVDVLLYNLS